MALFRVIAVPVDRQLPQDAKPRLELSDFGFWPLARAASISLRCVPCLRAARARGCSARSVDVPALGDRDLKLGDDVGDASANSAAVSRSAVGCLDVGMVHPL